MLSLQSQSSVIVDSIINKYPKSFNKPEKLASLINRDFDNDKDKVRAVYSWIVNNVSYDPEEYGVYSYSYKDLKEKEIKEEKYHSKLSERVISKNVAVCEGYSSLFKKLCDLLNITCHLVEGASKVDITDIGRRYNSNHVWNIVEINNTKYLIDVTWGAGSYSSKFKKQVTDYYFLTDPKLFIKNHYPDNYKHSLLNKVIDKEAFLNAPLIHHEGISFNDIVTPEEGVIKINKSTNNTIKFKLFWNEELNNINYLVGRKNISIQNYKFNDGVLEFPIEIDYDQRSLKRLTIYINKKPILGYRLKLIND